MHFLDLTRLAQGCAHTPPRRLAHALRPGPLPTSGEEGHMNSESQQSLSLWLATAKLPEYPSLDRNEIADACIVGAGIAGMTSAYLLSKAGHRVVVLDDGLIGNGETGRTTAHI